MAGGRSTRMGSDKASLLLDGKMLIEIVANNLKDGGASQIVVSVRDSKQSELIKNKFPSHHKIEIVNKTHIDQFVNCEIASCTSFAVTFSLFP